MQLMNVWFHELTSQSVPPTVTFCPVSENVTPAVRLGAAPKLEPLIDTAHPVVLQASYDSQKREKAHPIKSKDNTSQVKYRCDSDDGRREVGEWVALCDTIHIVRRHSKLVVCADPRRDKALWTKYALHDG